MNILKLATASGDLGDNDRPPGMTEYPPAPVEPVIIRHIAKFFLIPFFIVHYGRIIVLHMAILFGAFVITALGSPVFLLFLLIAGKILLDAQLHLRSHAKLNQAEA